MDVRHGGLLLAAEAQNRKLIDGIASLDAAVASVARAGSRNTLPELREGSLPMLDSCAHRD